jgi:hypothetical protein
LQIDIPGTLLAWPDGQGVHAQSVTKTYASNSANVHDTVWALPAEYEPAWQSPFGDESPVPEQYLPAGQGVHTADVAPPAEYEPAWHSPLTAP